MKITEAKGAMVAVAKHLSVPLKPMDMNEGVWGQNAQANCLKLTKAFGWPNPSSNISPFLTRSMYAGTFSSEPMVFSILSTASLAPPCRGP